MKILLVKPPSHMDVILPPLGLGYLAASVRNMHPDFEISVLDCLKEKYNLAQFKEYLIKFRPDLVGFTAFTLEIEAALQCAQTVKNYNPGIITVIGGAHVSGCPEEILGNRSIDFIFQGEAEHSFPLFLKAISTHNFKDIPGLGYKENSVLRFNPATFIGNLDTLKAPDYDLIKFQEYPQTFFSKRFPAAPILTSRGCPYECTFCSGHNISGRKWRFRSAENIIAEIKILYEKYKIKEFSIWDDNFALDKERALKFCCLLKESGLDVIWSCPNGVSLDTLDEELLIAMKAAGCYALVFGVESGSARILKDMKKKLSFKKLELIVSLASKMGFQTKGFFIIGYPTEQKEDILQTIQLAKKLPFSRASFFLFQPLLGSQIYNELKITNRLPEDLKPDDCEYSRPSVLICGINDLKHLKRLQQQAMLGFFLRPKILFRFLWDNLSLVKFKIITRIIKKYFFDK